ncbi:hypothetical protein [Paraburkholderia susongensis]|uniref:Uncharacterized protein n=1 Tax=Paraburkholderia susongensis TaxID=1515439 RepID=A0A1X7JKD7_9BURK|nr:hypothetical protein [Paraburkholderia susongensis]SMG28246.1 hypothetical protein SAMN06265784_102738 [Paraburkholderia susongensis]
MHLAFESGGGRAEFQLALNFYESANYTYDREEGHKLPILTEQRRHPGVNMCAARSPSGTLLLLTFLEGGLMQV